MLRRLQDHQARLAVRAWEYRQRHRAKGVWFRFRRILAEAEHIYVASEADANVLLAAGREPESVGFELHPHKLMLFASAVEVARLSAARELPPRLDAELLAASVLILVPFGEAHRGPGHDGP